MPHTQQRRVQQRRVGNRFGFTLVEVVVALLLVTTGLLALAGTAGYLARALTTSASIVTATRQARSGLERVRADPCPAAAGAPGSATYRPQPAEATIPLSHGATVEGKRSVTLRTEFPCPR